MRPVVSILCLFALLACARAQEQESGLWNRLSASRDRALEAMNNPKKKHPELASPMMNKSFEGNDKSIADRKAGVGTFKIDKKTAPGSKFTTRSFLGIKNPWFGSKVTDTKKADLFAKSALENSDRKIDSETVKANDFYQVDKKLMNRDQVAETRPYLGRGAAQGALDEQTAKAKDMTIDEVRDLLNKSKTRAQAQAQPVQQ